MQRMLIALFLGVLAFGAGCQAVSTAGGYEPANCAMVGSSCEGS
jgi:hypothetical protein